MKQVVSTDRAPAAIGPYAQAVTLNGLIITSGQLPIDPATGAFPEGIQAQTRQSLTNVKAILEAAGSSMDKVVKTTVFPVSYTHLDVYKRQGLLRRYHC